MQGRAIPALILGALIVLSVLATFSAMQLAGLDRSLSDAFGHRMHGMQELTEEVQVGDRTVTVRTVQREGETVQALVARHRAAVLEVRENG